MDEIQDQQQSFETVKIVGSEEDAALVMGFLQANGVEASVESLHASEFPTEVGPLSEVRIQVPAAQAAEAHRLLAESEATAAPPISEG